ncbi:MAG: aminotransferase class I/II-fold pyridoxal phosphate-dependent enzyme, partial [Zetaproteobacteria bacterium]|nr:aminotransferase class I/II-fold pyridoxal phosphate-dependent enzyme [Zetaproteobacteria bacterium]
AFFTFAQVNPDLKERTITLNGVSKAYCMTGWRIGYCAGPRHLIQSMAKAQSQSTSNPCSISQKAALAALTGPTDALDAMVHTYETRRTWLVHRLNQIKGVNCMVPDGAFYLFPSIAAWLGKKCSNGLSLNSDIDVCAWLLEEAGVALVPGTEFGAPGHLRISYAVAQETIEDAMDRIDLAVRSLID